jgi:hypothetical protein
MQAKEPFEVFDFDPPARLRRGVRAIEMYDPALASLAVARPPETKFQGHAPQREFLK